MTTLMRVRSSVVLNLLSIRLETFPGLVISLDRPIKGSRPNIIKTCKVWPNLRKISNNHLGFWIRLGNNRAPVNKIGS